MRDGDGGRTRRRSLASRTGRENPPTRVRASPGPRARRRPHRIVSRGMSERAGRRRATFSSPRAWRRSFADFLEFEETKRGLSEFEPRLTHGARFAAMAPPPRQDPIPGSYIRETVTSEGATRWNVRAYDARTRATVTLGTFGNLAEAKGAYWAHEKKAAAEKKPSSSPNPPRTKTAPEEATRAKKPTARSKTAREREPVAPPPSAKRAPKKGAVNTPAKKRPAAKGEKRPRAGKAPSSPRAPKRRRSSAATTTTAMTTITSPPRTPRDSARMRNLAEAAALATTSANKKLPPKKRGLPSPTNPNLLDTSPPPTASFAKNHAMKRQSPRLASPRSTRPRRRSKGGHVIWSPQAKPPLRANTAVRQALCDAAADVAHVIAAAAPPPATKDSGSPMTTLGGIARRLSDGLLGLLSSQCGAGGSQRSSGTDTAVLVSLFLFSYGQLH